MIRTSRLVPLLLCLLLLAGQSLHADVVVLKTGDRIEGKIVLETDTEVWLKIKGGELNLKRANIERIIRGPWEPEVEEPEKEETKPEKEETKPEKEETKPEKEETRPEKEETKPEEGEGEETLEELPENGGAERATPEQVLQALLEGELTEEKQGAFAALRQEGMTLVLERLPNLTPENIDRILSAIPPAPNPEEGKPEAGDTETNGDEEEGEEAEESAPEEPFDPVPFLKGVLGREDLPTPTVVAALKLLRTGYADERVLPEILDRVTVDANDLPEDNLQLLIHGMAILGQAGDADVATDLIEVLDRPPVHRKGLAHSALLKILSRTRRAPRRLHRQLTDVVEDLREPVARRQTAWQLLRAVLTDDDYRTLLVLRRSQNPVDRRWAADGFARLPGRGSQAQLYRLLQDPDNTVRKAAVRAIKDSNRREFVPYLINLLNRSDRRLVEAAKRALRALTEQDIDGGYRDWIRWWSEAKKSSPWSRYVR